MSLLAAIRRDPGLTGAELAAVLRAHSSTVHYHARVLAHFGYVAEVRMGRDRVYVDAAIAEAGDAAAVCRLRSDPGAMLLLAQLHSAAPLRVSEAGLATGMPTQVLQGAMRRLDALGLLEVSGRGHRRALRIPVAALPRAQRLLLLHVSRDGRLPRLVASGFAADAREQAGAGPPVAESSVGATLGVAEKSEILRPAPAETS